MLIARRPELQKQNVIPHGQLQDQESIVIAKKHISRIEHQVSEIDEAHRQHHHLFQQIEQEEMKQRETKRRVSQGNSLQQPRSNLQYDNKNQDNRSVSPYLRFLNKAEHQYCRPSQQAQREQKFSLVHSHFKRQKQRQVVNSAISQSLFDKAHHSGTRHYVSHNEPHNLIRHQYVDQEVFIPQRLISNQLKAPRSPFENHSPRLLRPQEDENSVSDCDSRYFEQEDNENKSASSQSGVDEDLYGLVQSSKLHQTTVQGSEELSANEAINRPIVQNNKSNFLLLKQNESDFRVNSKMMGHTHFAQAKLQNGFSLNKQRGQECRPYFNSHIREVLNPSVYEGFDSPSHSVNSKHNIAGSGSPHQRIPLKLSNQRENLNVKKRGQSPLTFHNLLSHFANGQYHPTRNQPYKLQGANVQSTLQVPRAENILHSNRQFQQLIRNDTPSNPGQGASNRQRLAAAGANTTLSLVGDHLNGINQNFLPKQGPANIGGLNSNSHYLKHICEQFENEEQNRANSEIKFYNAFYKYKIGQNEQTQQDKAIALKLRIEKQDLYLYRSVGIVDKVWTMHSLPGCEFSLDEPLQADAARLKPEDLNIYEDSKQIDLAGSYYKLTIRLSESHKRLFFIKDEVTAQSLLKALRFSAGMRRLEQALVEGQDIHEGAQAEGRLHILGQGAYGKVYKANLRLDYFIANRNRVQTQGRGQMAECQVPEPFPSLTCHFGDGDHHGLLAVAVKVVKKAQLDPVELQQIHQEIEICKVLSEEPNERGLAKLLDVFEDMQQIYFVMEQVAPLQESKDATPNLLKWLMEKERSEFEVREVMRGLVATLHHLHSLGIVHRDIKMENLLLHTRLDQGQVSLTPKIIDFGLSAIVLEGEWRSENYGTVAYCSPEITGAEPHNHSTDVWSLGIVLFTLLSKRLPFIVPNLEQTIQNIQTKPISFAQPCWESRSELAKDLVNRMLYKDKLSRPSAEQILRHPWFTQLIVLEASKTPGLADYNRQTFQQQSRLQPQQ